MPTKAKFIIPLYNFEFDGEKILFDSSISIRKCEIEEIEEIKSIVKDARDFSFVIEQIKDNIYIHVVNSLRILKFGFFRTPYVLHKNINLVHQDFGTLTTGYDNYPYKLKESEIKELGYIYNQIKENKKKLMQKYPSLNSAIWLFTYSVRECNHNFRLINLFNALEALFLKGGELSELSYRLSLRTAHFIGKDRKDREKIFKLIKDGYSLRSKIVHGLRKKIETKDIDFTFEVENCIRECLKKYLGLIKKFTSEDRIIDYIDNIILE